MRELRNLVMAILYFILVPACAGLSPWTTGPKIGLVNASALKKSTAKEMESMLKRAGIIGGWGATVNVVATYKHPSLVEAEIREDAAVRLDPPEKVKAKIEALANQSPWFLIEIVNNYNIDTSTAKFWDFRLVVGDKVYEGKKEVSGLDVPQLSGPTGTELWRHVFSVSFPEAPFDLKGKFSLRAVSLSNAVIELEWTIAD